MRERELLCDQSSQSAEQPNAAAAVSRQHRNSSDLVFYIIYLSELLNTLNYNVNLYYILTEEVKCVCFRSIYIYTGYLIDNCIYLLEY